MLDTTPLLQFPKFMMIMVWFLAVGEEGDEGAEGKEGLLAPTSSSPKVNEEDDQQLLHPANDGIDLIEGKSLKNGDSDDNERRDHDLSHLDAHEEDEEEEKDARSRTVTKKSHLSKTDLLNSSPIKPPKALPNFRVKKDDGLTVASSRVSPDDEDEEDEEDMMYISAPLDFSVKLESSKRRVVDEPPVLEKKVKRDSDGKTTAAPLDLSVKKSSLSHSRQIPHPLLNQSHPRHHVPVTNSVSSSSPRKDFLSPAAKSYQSQLTFLPIKTSSLSHLKSNSSPAHTVNGADKSRSPKNPLGLATRSVGPHGRQNPWQTQWMNRSSEQTRDVFTCVWCKDRFRSLQEMTIHMKESPRCGMAGMQQAAASASASLASLTPSSSSIPNTSLNGRRSSSPVIKGRTSGSSSGSQSNSSNSTSKEPMSSAVLAKNNVALPRKLVRGQDVWLGRGAEQTRQILKCKC